MLQHKLILILLLPVMYSFTGCNSDKKKDKKVQLTEQQIKEASINVNKKLVTQDQEKIKEYLQENELDFTVHPSGLWYKIEKNKKDAYTIRSSDQVIFSFTVKNLEQELFYSSKEEGLKTVVVGHSNIEAGLDTGLKLLSKGDSAVFIIPPHLAWGNVGDDVKIPGRTILIYEVKILDVYQR